MDFPVVLPSCHFRYARSKTDKILLFAYRCRISGYSRQQIRRNWFGVFTNRDKLSGMFPQVMGLSLSFAEAEYSPSQMPIATTIDPVAQTGFHLIDVIPVHDSDQFLLALYGFL